MSAPRTAREAWMAQVFADLDQLLVRVEQMVVRVEASGTALRDSAAALDAASTRYRSVVAQFTAQAKRELAVEQSARSQETSPGLARILARLDAVAQAQRTFQRRALGYLAGLGLLELAVLAALVR